jgi:hypothetical protein
MINLITIYWALVKSFAIFFQEMCKSSGSKCVDFSLSFFGRFIDDPGENNDFRSTGLGSRKLIFSSSLGAFLFGFDLFVRDTVNQYNTNITS